MYHDADDLMMLMIGDNYDVDDHHNDDAEEWWCGQCVEWFRTTADSADDNNHDDNDNTGNINDNIKMTTMIHIAATLPIAITIAKTISTKTNSITKSKNSNNNYCIKRT